MLNIAHHCSKRGLIKLIYFHRQFRSRQENLTLYVAEKNFDCNFLSIFLEIS